MPVAAKTKTKTTKRAAKKLKVDELEKEIVRRKEVRKETGIRFRVTDVQKRVLMAAAEKDGSGLSFWLLQLGLRAAEARLTPEELERARTG